MGSLVKSRTIQFGNILNRAPSFNLKFESLKKKNGGKFFEYTKIEYLPTISRNK